ncbi:hypothetical protein CL622_01010 [archaeon]|nr:hypothetical protein [archaeon]|tara:strand:+ start:457 stop:999 length:543 start_codon:yes stop_codon:yes gene_type:complete
MTDQIDPKDMSPEQIQELMKKNCLFCGMLNGQVPVTKVYEDDICIAILDIGPANPGHTLVFPKEHAMSITEVDPKIFITVQALVAAQIKGLGVKGVSVYVAEGEAAGQKLPHASIHIIPRVEGDGLFVWQGKQADEKALQPIAEKIMANILMPQQAAIAPKPVEPEEVEVVEDTEDERVP